MTIASSCIAAAPAAAQPIRGAHLAGVNTGLLCAGASTLAIAHVLMGLSQRRQQQAAALPRSVDVSQPPFVVEATNRRTEF